MAATRRPNLKLLRALEKNSETLDQVGKSFVQVLEGSPDLHVYSFREEKETRKYFIFNTMVVEADSAMIGIGREETSSIPESHSGMTKFASKGDIGFKRVSAQIQRWVRALPSNVLVVTEDAMYGDCLSSLNSATIGLRLKSVAENYPKTFQWIFDDNVVSFSKWLQDSENKQGSIYWIQGKPGSGKSTLMKFAMGHPQTTRLLRASEDIPHTVAGFFFHDRGSEIQKSISGMLRGLLHSILVQCSQLRQFVHPIYADLAFAQNTKTPDWSFESLTMAFKSMFSNVKGWPGFSEADGIWVKIKNCVASRPWDIFLAHFSENPGFKIHEFTAGDILNYTSGRFNDAAPKYGSDKAIGAKRSADLESLASRVSQKSQGVFIWVRIVVEEIVRGIRDRTPYFRLNEILESMPEELGDLYEHTLRRIEPHHVEEAFAMLQIAICAKEPLRLDTFVNTTSHAVWQKVPELGEETMDDMIQRVIGRSGGLLEVDHIAGREMPSSGSRVRPTHIVQFIHQTVKEFVQKRKDDLPLKRKSSEGTGYGFLFTAGVLYLGPWAGEIEMDVFHYARLTSLGQQETPRSAEYHDKLMATLELMANRYTSNVRVQEFLQELLPIRGIIISKRHSSKQYT